MLKDWGLRGFLNFFSFLFFVKCQSMTFFRRQFMYNVHSTLHYILSIKENVLEPCYIDCSNDWMRRDYAMCDSSRLYH